MNSNQLSLALGSHKDTRTFFKGVFAADRLPRKCYPPSALIVNTDPARKQGTHWVGIFIDENRRGDFFDSYGLPPYIKEHITFLDRECSSWRYNRKKIQGWTSATCGSYSSVFLAYRCKGFSMNHFLKHFNAENNKKNDEVIIKLYNELFGKYCKKCTINRSLLSVQIGRAAYTLPKTQQ